MPSVSASLASPSLTSASPGFDAGVLAEGVGAELGRIFGGEWVHGPELIEVFPTPALPFRPARRRFGSVGVTGTLAAAVAGFAVGAALTPGLHPRAQPQAPRAAPPSRSAQAEVLLDAAASPARVPTNPPSQPTAAKAVQPSQARSASNARAPASRAVPDRGRLGPATASPARAPSATAEPRVGAAINDGEAVADPRCPATGCVDEALAVAERELQASYRRARRAGVPPAILFEDRDRWRAYRDSAGDRSRGALLRAYGRWREHVDDIADGAILRRRDAGGPGLFERPYPGRP